MGLIDNNEIIYKSSKSFFWASKFLSEEILQKVINIYSFCRIHDDLVDENIEATDKKEIELLEQKIKSYGISGDVISELIKGINSDINFQRYKNNAALIKYCYRVAGIVGLMMIKALKIKNIEASYYAFDLGIAMQLTNISRDIMEDFSKKRIYLPEDSGITYDVLDNPNKVNNMKICNEVNKILIKSDILLSSLLTTFAPKPIEVSLPLASITLSNPANAPPQINKIFVVSTCKNSCCGCFLPP